MALSHQVWTLQEKSGWGGGGGEGGASSKRSMLSAKWTPKHLEVLVSLHALFPPWKNYKISSPVVILWMDEIHFATWKPWENSLFVGFFMGSIIALFLRWCRISSIHSSFPLKPTRGIKTYSLANGSESSLGILPSTHHLTAQATHFNSELRT